MSEDFGELSRNYRLAAGFGLRRFAAMVNLKASNLSDVEHGRRRPPEGPDKLREIADALGLMDGSEQCLA
jgi:transcriptional regulator with XRE-family HTH domain